jgi:hypothetical protein
VSFSGAGTCKVTARQAGVDGWSAASAKSVSFKVVKTAQVITFVAPAGPYYVGDHVILDTDAVSSSSGLPVTISSSGVGCAAVTGSVSADPSSTVEVDFAAAGSCTVTASQAANTAYSAAASKKWSFKVVKRSQSIQFPGDFPTTTTVHSTVSLSGISATSGGAVTVVASGGKCTISDGVVTMNTRGTCTLKATQGGSSTWAAAPSVTKKITIVNPT